MSVSGSTQGPSQDVNGSYGRSARELMSANKPLMIGVAALIAAVLAAVAIGLLAGSSGAVSDSTLCSGWSSASQTKQQAYGELYLQEHGPVANGVSTPSGVVAAINKGCMDALASGIEDNVNVVQAISGQ
jgi:hypothetical protein